MGEEESSLMTAAAAGSSSSTASESSTDTAPHPPSHSRMSGPTRRSTKGGWTEEEDANLVTKVQLYKGKNWKKIAESFPGRTDVQCLHRWQKVLNPDLVKGPWTKEEDDHIMKLVKIYGPKKWSLIAKSLPGRIGKQCRERWHNHLNPSIKKDAWTEAEEFLLIRAHQIYGNKWAEIARFLPGRADNSIKNHWHCSVKKKLGLYEASGLLCPLPAFSTPELVLPRKEVQYVEIESDKQNERIVSNNGEVGQGDIADTAFVSTVATNESKVGKLFNSRLEEGNSLDRVQNNSNVTIDKLSRTTNDKRPTTTNGSVAEASDYTATFLTLSSRVSLSEMSNEQIQMSLSSKLHPFSLLAQAKKNRNLDKNEDTGGQAAAGETKENKESYTVRSSCSDIPFSSLAQAKKNRIQEETEDNSVGKSVGTETKESKEGGKVRASCSNVPVDVKKSSMVVCGRPSLLDQACNLANFDDQSVSGSSLESHPQLMKSPSCSTPDSCSTWTTARFGNSPVLFLRNAARTFRNTPSILRKRGRDDYSHDKICTIQHRNYCMPEASSRGSKVPQSVTSLDVNQDHHERLLVSSPASLKPEAAAASERVEKCLESVFDMEWDKASAKCV